MREERLVSYRIYADRVWIMHTCINVLLLFLTAKLSGITVRVRRIIEIAAGNALCFTAILLLPAPAVLQGEVGIILAGKTFFCLIAALWWVQRCFQVKSREGMRRVWICYMCCACVLGGVCNGISEVRELFGTDQNGFGTGGQVSMMQLLVWCAIVVWYGAKLLERERRRQKHPIWKVSFFWKTKFFSGSALMDSGNSLKDPYTGRPVCVLDEETAKKLGISTEKAISEQLFVVCKADKDIGAVHGGIKEARDHAEDHGVDDEPQKEDQAGQKEEIGCDGLLPDQCAAALWLFDFYGGSSQENHQTFRLAPVK